VSWRVRDFHRRCFTGVTEATRKAVVDATHSWQLTVWTGMALALAASLGGILLAYSWNRSLVREVRARTVFAGGRDSGIAGSAGTQSDRGGECSGCAERRTVPLDATTSVVISFSGASSATGEVWGPHAGPVLSFAQIVRLSGFRLLFSDRSPSGWQRRKCLI